jgi:hypothetical protein
VPRGATWAIVGLCPGWTATLLQEDRVTPAANPLGFTPPFPGWTGWIAVTAPAGTPAGTTCCFQIQFVCNGKPGVINLCVTTCDWPLLHPTLTTVDWRTIGDLERFHLRWTNPDPDRTTVAVSGAMNSQQFGAFVENAGTIGTFQVPELLPDSFFDVFFDVPLAQLPPEPQRVLPGGGPSVQEPCPPETLWTGNVDVMWSDPEGGTGEEHHHHGTLLVRPGATPSLLHMLVGCAVPPGATWSIVGLCPGWTATLLEEDRVTPAGNPLGFTPPFPGWTGWLAVSAPAGTPAGTTCCFQIQFMCNGQPGVIHMCVTTCDWALLQPTLASVEWSTVGDLERFHMQWANPDPLRTTVAISGAMNSQQFGVFVENAGTIGTFNVPPLAPSSFFDVFFEVPLSQLPPEPPKQLPGGGPLFPGPCPPDTSWIGNVDIQWAEGGAGGGGGIANHHHGQILVRPGPTPSVLHLIVGCAVPPGATWAVVGLLPGWTATLVQEDKVTPAPNPLGVQAPPLPPWTGWIAITAPAGTPVGTVCCFQIVFTCNGQQGVIRLCATACNWVNTDVPLPPQGLEFGIYAALPNPTTGATLIGFALPKAAHARLDVYDLAGKHVATLMDGMAQAGPNSVRWNGAGDSRRTLPPGTYFVTLRSDARFASRKLVMVR